MDAIVLHHIFKPLDFHPALDFHPVEANLRECFRLLAAERARGDVLELPGVTIASAGVSFQMFNAAFLSTPIADANELAERIAMARAHFSARALRWSFWFCDDWVARGLRRKAGAVFQNAGMHLTSEMPGMVAPELRLSGAGTRLRLQAAETGGGLLQFRQIGALCFHVPPAWFAEVFDDAMPQRPGFRAWVGYEGGTPVGTAAVVFGGGVVGLYNIAVLPEYRRRGYGSEITALAAAEALNSHPASGLILQASSQGVRMYERMGFRDVTRVLVYNSP